MQSLLDGQMSRPQGAGKPEIDESMHFKQAAAEAARDIPEIQTEKIEAVKKQIETGGYSVGSRDVAAKILEQHKRP